METLNTTKQTQGFATKVFTRVLASLGVVLALAACGNSSSNNTGGLSGCVNCSSLTNAQAMATFQSTSIYSTQFPLQMTNMTLYGNNVTNTIAGFNGTTTTQSVDTYQGAIAVNGTMIIGAQIMDVSGACIIPAGTYTVQTYSQGYMSGGDLQVQMLVNGNIMMTLQQGMIANYNGSYWVSGALIINSVNNVQCNSFYTSMD